MLSTQMEDTEPVQVNVGSRKPIPLPASVEINLADFETIDTTPVDTEFHLTTELGMFEVHDVPRKEYALAHGRDFHWICEEKRLGIFFARGAIDEWCAYIAKCDDTGVWHLYAPKDKFYFERIFYVAYMQEKAYPSRKYSPFHKLFNELYYIANIMYADPTHIKADICEQIDKIVNFYREENEEYVDMLATAMYEIYYGMVAEENKENTILGRTIKIIGLHDMLIDRIGVDAACDRNRNVKVDRIKAECNNMGYIWLARNAVSNY